MAFRQPRSLPPCRMRVPTLPVMTQGDDLLFFADPFSQGSQLWKSDGTYAGTHVIKDQPNLVVQNSVSSTAIVDGLLYFLANDGTSGYELWRSDGTSSGTFQVIELRPAAVPPTSAKWLTWMACCILLPTLVPVPKFGKATVLRQGLSKSQMTRLGSSASTTHKLCGRTVLHCLQRRGRRRTMEN